MAMKHVIEDVGSDDYKYWRVSMAGLSDAELEHGRKAAETFNGYLTLGAFQALCNAGEAAAYHKLYAPLPAPKLDVEKRKAMAKKMREDTGFTGPATNLREHYR